MKSQVRTTTCEIPKPVDILLYINGNVIVRLVRVMGFFRRHKENKKGESGDGKKITLLL